MASLFSVFGQILFLIVGGAFFVIGFLSLEGASAITIKTG